MLKKQLITFGLSITALLAVLLIFGMTVSTAKATVLGFQNILNDAAETAFNNGGFQCLGTGLTGTVESISTVADMTFGASGFPRYMSYDLVTFTNQTDCEEADVNAAIDTEEYRSTKTAGTVYTQELATSDVAASAPVTMIATNWYGVMFRGNITDGLISNIRPYGSPTQVCGLPQYSSTSGTGPSFTADANIFNIFVQLNTTNATYDAGATQCTGFTAPVINETTRINSITPAPDSTQASSTSFTFGATGYVNDDEWNGDTVLYIRYGQQTGMGLRDNGPISERGELTIPITSSGDFNLSTTTSVIHSGVYIGYVAIQKPKFNLFGFNFFTETLAANTWLFTVATSSARELESTVLLLSTSGAGQNLASTTLANGSLTACQNFLTGSTTECIVSMFVPSGEQLTGAASVMNSALGNNLPFSMFWQPYTLLKSISGSTTPVTGTDIVVNMHNTFITGSTTIFSWSGAKDTVNEAIPDSAVLYLIYAEWIFFGLYCIWRLTKNI